MGGNPGQIRAIQGERAKLKDQEEGIKEGIKQLGKSLEGVKAAGAKQLKEIDGNLEKLHDLLGNPSVPDGQKGQVREQISYLKRAKDSIKTQIVAQVKKINDEITKLESYLKPIGAAKKQMEKALTMMAGQAAINMGPEGKNKKG